MNIRIIATTSTKDLENKDDFNLLSGKIAGICYNEQGFDKLENEPISATKKRIKITKGNGHHSVYEHEYISLYLENIPKLLAMVLNNEKVYVTSEKSARYTQMPAEGLEKELYDKWYAIFVEEITKKYGQLPYFTTTRIKKLAQENARYFLSIYNPTTCMAYTTSYRQLNYLYSWLKNIEHNENPLLQKLSSYTNEFCDQLKKLNLIDDELQDDGKNRSISLLANDNNLRKDYFSDVYCTTYKGSWAQLAQAQRHRTINYQIQVEDTPSFYVPKLLRTLPQLEKEWLADMQKVKDLHPQGELVQIIERGTPENFILKTYERLCTCAQLEIMEQTKQTLQKYSDEAVEQRIKDMFQYFKKGARCTFPGFECKTPCQFKEGVNLDRDI